MNAYRKILSQLSVTPAGAPRPAGRRGPGTRRAGPGRGSESRGSSARTDDLKGAGTAPTTSWIRLSRPGWIVTMMGPPGVFRVRGTPPSQGRGRRQLGCD